MCEVHVRKEEEQCISVRQGEPADRTFRVEQRSAPIVITSLGCHDKMTQTGWLKLRDISLS
jgi:hypothetical protein